MKPSLDYVKAILGFPHSFLFGAGCDVLVWLKCLSYLFKDHCHAKSLSLNNNVKKQCNGLDNIHDGLEKLLGS